MHLNLLEKGNVPTLDLRESIHEDNLSHYDMFSNRSSLENVQRTVGV